MKPAAATESKKDEAEKEDNNEDDEDTPPKVEIKPVQEDDAFYSIRWFLISFIPFLDVNYSFIPRY